MTGHETEQAAHSPIGASSCERWWNCPGSVKLIASVPHKNGTKYTAQGTVAHSLGEDYINGILAHISVDSLSSRLLDEVGRSYVEDDFEIEVTDDMVEAVELYGETVRQYLSDMGFSLGMDPYYTHPEVPSLSPHFIDPHYLRPEVRFQLTHIDPEAFGTCDCVIYAPFHKIVVIDYKHGEGYAVEVENNHQLLYYALGAYYSLPENERTMLSEIETVIVQPRAKHLHGPVRKHSYTVAELLAHEAELVEAVARVRADSSELAVGSWCKFCAGKPVCPKTLARLQEETKLAFSDAIDKPVELPVNSTLSEEQRGVIMRNAEAIQDWCRSVVAMCTTAVEQGHAVEGFKLVKKYGHRRWKSEADVEAAFSLEFGDAIYNKKLRSPAQFEKLLKKKRKDEIAPYVEVPVSGTTLVPEGDARPDIPTGVTAMFDTLET